MKRKWIVAATAAPCAVALVMGCTGDDEFFAPGKDAGSFEAAPPPDGSTVTPPDGGDASAPNGCDDVAGVPPRLLLTMNNTTTSELVAFDVAAKSVSGRFTYAGFLGTTWSQGATPYVLAQSADRVYRMDAKEPWRPVSSWNVAGDDKPDGGSAYADPVAVVVPSCKKGYVLRFNRNKILVVDTTQVADGGAPVSSIDLSPLLQPGDADGLVDVTSAVWVPSKKRIYVLLGNLDKKKVAPDGFTALCATTKPAIVAIDPDTDSIVSLGGNGPGGGILLEGYNPPLGTPLVYDAALDRLVVLEAGCNTDDGAGGPGPIARRRVEEVQLATRQVRTLLSLDAKGFPSSLVYVDATRAAIAFFGEAYFWNPQESALGAPLPSPPDVLVWDGKGNVLGPRSTFVDGGPGPIDIVSVPLSDGGADAGAPQKLGSGPFTDNTGFVGGAELWPRP
jgi:hypothetical protein